MKRFAFKLLLFLLLGTILNVAVAWGCALWPVGSTQRSAPSPEERSWLRLHDEQPANYQTGYWGISSFGCDMFACRLMDSDFEERTKQKLDDSGDAVFLAPRYRVDRSFAGWPLRVLKSYDFLHTTDWRRLHPSESAIESHGELLLPFVDWYVPAKAIWPGFAINTIFYTAILWLLFAFPRVPFTVRRHRRIKRGLCPACAYDLRGRGNDSKTCPECGKAVKQ